MDENLKKELEALSKNIKGDTMAKVEEKVKALVESHGIEYHKASEEKFNKIKAFNEKLEADLKEANENIVKMDAKLAEVKASEIDSKGFLGAWAEMVKSNEEAIRMSGGSSEVKMTLETKAPMTLATSLTGTAVQTYQAGDAENPSQAVNFRSLVPAIQSATGIYIVYREGAVTGAPADQVEGSAKAEVTFAWSEVTFTAAYLAGFTQFSRQMATDLPFLSTSLPAALLREYYKAENAKFYTALAAAATASTEIITGKNKAEMLLNDMATLEAADWMPTGILVTPSDWYDLLKTAYPSTGTDYSMPGAVFYQNGQLIFNGVPLIRATWVGANKYIVGNWTQASRLTVAGEGLNVRFFEQDSDNVQKNLVTARVEERNVLVIDRPDAFILGDFTST